MRLREDRKDALVIGLSLLLWMVSLYQLEIIWIWLRMGKETFEFPFFLLTTNLWVARDFWYTVNGMSLIIPIAYLLFEDEKKKRKGKK